MKPLQNIEISQINPSDNHDSETELITIDNLKHLFGDTLNQLNLLVASLKTPEEK